MSRQPRGARRDVTVDLHAPVDGQLDLLSLPATTPLPSPREEADGASAQPSAEEVERG